MEEEQPFVSEPAPPPTPDAPPPNAAVAEREIAPWWSVALLVAFILFMSLAGAGGKHEGARAMGPMVVYLPTVLMQWAMLLFAWWSLHRRGNRLRDLIGGRWATVEDVFMDVILAAGAYVSFIIMAILFVVVQMATNMISKDGLAQTAQHNQDVLGFMLPRNGLEVAMMILVCVTAGVCEEVVFRGVVQKALLRWTRSAWLALPLAALVFGLAHGYQGAGNMIKVGLLGLLLGGLAYWRKSLRPCMLMHAGNDMISFFALMAMQKAGASALPHPHALTSWLG